MFHNWFVVSISPRLTHCAPPGLLCPDGPGMLQKLTGDGHPFGFFSNQVSGCGYK